MDDKATKQIRPIHTNNKQLGIFTNPLPSSQPRGYIGMVSVSNELHH